MTGGLDSPSQGGTSTVSMWWAAGWDTSGPTSTATFRSYMPQIKMTFILLWGGGWSKTLDTYFVLTNIMDFQMTFMCEYNDRNNEVPPPTTTEHQSLGGKGDSVSVKTAFVETRHEIETEHSTERRGLDVTTTLFDILESAEDYIDADYSEDSDEQSTKDDNADISIGEGSAWSIVHLFRSIFAIALSSSDQTHA